MAPLASEPRQLLVVLNVARRRALYTLISEITAYMRAQLELKEDYGSNSGGSGPAPDSRDAPLFATPKNERDADDDAGGGVDASVSQRILPPSAELVQLRRAALVQFDTWRSAVLTKLKEVVSAPDDGKLVEERRRRGERVVRQRAAQPEEGESLIDFGSAGDGADGEQEREQERRTKKAVVALQSLYHPIPTRLVTIPVEDRREAVSAVLLLLLSMGNYSAHSRAMATYLTSALELPLALLEGEETEIAKSLVETSTSAEAQAQAGGNGGGAVTMSADAEAQKRRQENQSSRYWKVGLASVAGAAVIGITGGLAAPVVAGAIGGLMGTVGLGGVASFLGIFWMNGALVGTLFGAFGARMTGEMMDQYAREVEDFRFLPLKEEWGKDCRKEDKDGKDVRRLRVTIGVNGWLTSKEDVTKPWRCLGDESEVFALRYEMDSLLALGKSLEGLVSSYAWSYVKVEILRRTVLATLWSALWPAYLLSLASSIDNPFSLARNRSEKAGRILADALINRVQGERPVTLVGYSLGARVIYSCLRSLAARKAFGLVDTVVFIGAPIPSNRTHFQTMRTVVSGKIFNVYSENDFILAFLYRTTSIQLGIAGLQAIKDIEGVENLNLSDSVKGHLRYPDLIGRILARCGFPNVKGGDGPIEKEEEEIKLQDSDGAGNKTGNLIDFDDLAISDTKSPKQPEPEPKSVHALKSQARPAFPAAPEEPPRRPSRPVVARPKTVALKGQEANPLSEQKTLAPEQKNLAPQPPPEPAPQQDRASPRPSSLREPEATPAPAPKPAAKPGPRPPTPEPDSDEDDEGYIGIKMVDNDEDDMVTYVEPIPIED